jgi:UDP-N-acetyl-D-mannosaminuronate dehydrogenase
MVKRPSRKIGSEKAQRIGFIGLGSMGEPMALKLAKAGSPPVV